MLVHSLPTQDTWCYYFSLQLLFFFGLLFKIFLYIKYSSYIKLITSGKLYIFWYQSLISILILILFLKILIVFFHIFFLHLHGFIILGTLYVLIMILCKFFLNALYSTILFADLSIFGPVWTPFMMIVTYTVYVSMEIMCISHNVQGFNSQTTGKKTFHHYKRLGAKKKTRNKKPIFLILGIQNTFIKHTINPTTHSFPPSVEELQFLYITNFLLKCKVYSKMRRVVFFKDKGSYPGPQAYQS